jgi:hypothetical protein
MITRKVKEVLFLAPLTPTFSPRQRVEREKTGFPKFYSSEHRGVLSQSPLSNRLSITPKLVSHGFSALSPLSLGGEG